MKKICYIKISLLIVIAAMMVGGNTVLANDTSGMHMSAAEVDEMQRMARLVRDEDATHVSVSRKW